MEDMNHMITEYKKKSRKDKEFHEKLEQKRTVSRGQDKVILNMILS